MGGKSRLKKGKARKDNDTVDLKPRASDRGSSGVSRDSDETHECSPSFEIPLPSAKHLVLGTKLSLQKQNDEWFVIANGKELTTAGKRRSAMLTECFENGYRYRGGLRSRNGQKYGAFQRTS
jgi:hypothetical protein